MGDCYQETKRQALLLILNDVEDAKYAARQYLDEAGWVSVECCDFEIPALVKRLDDGNLVVAMTIAGALDWEKENADS